MERASTAHLSVSRPAGGCSRPFFADLHALRPKPARFKSHCVAARAHVRARETPYRPATMTNPPSKSHGRLSIRATAAPRELMEQRPERAGAWVARVITLFPDAFPGVLGLSLTGKALENGLWRLEPIDLRPFGEGKHRNVDDTPAGGGAGMVLRPDIMARAIRFAQQGVPDDRARWPLIYLSPRGRRFDQPMARRLADAEGITLICGRFEGLDERVIEHFEVEEVSIGDYVLSGGEIAAQAVIDAALRLQPGVLGNAASVQEESFQGGLLEHPHYTRPATWEGLNIPEVLTSGDHGRVASWRREISEQLTAERRPDLWAAHAAEALPAAVRDVTDAARLEAFLAAHPHDDVHLADALSSPLPPNPWMALAWLAWQAKTPPEKG